MTQTKCPKCSHEWNYKGHARFITCPTCRSIFKNPEWKGFDKGGPGMGMSVSTMYAAKDLGYEVEYLDREGVNKLLGEEDE